MKCFLAKYSRLRAATPETIQALPKAKMQQADERQKKKDNMQCNDRRSPVAQQGLRGGNGPQSVFYSTQEVGGGSRVFSIF